jgi:hypothetical protein
MGGDQLSEKTADKEDDQGNDRKSGGLTEGGKKFSKRNFLP